MSEFDGTSTSYDIDSPDTSTDSYKLTGPPKALPITAAVLVISSLIVTLIFIDSVIAFSLAVTSCIVSLLTRAQNQNRMNRPTYSTSRWFGIATTSIYASASLLALTQIIMVAYVAGR